MRLLLLLVLFSSLSGCVAGGWAVSAGPTLDTEGEVGIMLQARMGLGIATSTHAGVILSPRAGVGAGFTPGRFQVKAGAEIDWVHYWQNQGLRVGLSDGYIGSSDPNGWRNDLFASVPTALLFVLDNKYFRGHEKGLSASSNTFHSFGILFEPSILLPASGEDRPNRWSFFLGPVYEVDSFSRW